MSEDDDGLDADATDADDADDADRDDDGAETEDDRVPAAGEFGIEDDGPGSTNDDRSQSSDHAGDEADGRDLSDFDESGSSDFDEADPSDFDESDTTADAPLGSLASSVEERRERSSEQPEDDLFSEESVPEIDADVVWERIDEEAPELPGESDPVVRVIEKRNYCEQCPFFSAPPAVGCTHEGTEILELVDMAHFRVVDCPKVAEDERLERL